MSFRKAVALFGIGLFILAISQTIYLLPSFSPSSSKSSLENPPSSNNPEVQGSSTVNQKQGFDNETLYLLINAYRKDHKLSSLLIEPTLEMSAGAKIKDMVQNNYFRHTDVQNQDTWYFFTNAGYDYKRAGENISFKHNTPWQVFEGWVDSPTHNQQLLTQEYEEMGLSSDCESLAEYQGDTCIVVLHLGLR